MNDSNQNLRRQLAKIAKNLVGHEKRISIVERTAQAKHVSITDGSTTYYNTDGEPVVVTGLQPDGTYTTVDLNGVALEPPSPPILTSQPGIILVAWDGANRFESLMWPANFSHIEVHMSLVENFIPTDITEIATFHGVKGGTLTLALTENTYYFKLVAVNSSGVESAASTEVSAEPLPLEGGIQTYRTDDAPAGLDIDDVGALWIDTNDDNRLYYWDGATWIDIQPSAIDQAVDDSIAALNEAQDRVKFDYGTTRPTGLTADDRMLWMDPNNGYAAEYWDGTAWSPYFFGPEAVGFDARDIGGILTSVGLAPPSNPIEGDIWYNASEGNRPERWTSGAWVVVQDAAALEAASAAANAMNAANDAMDAVQVAQATADGSIRTYYASTPPWADGSTQPDSVLGDMWFDEDTGQAYRWNGTTWTLIEDSSIAVALAAAVNAQSTADGKINSYYSTTTPSVNGEGEFLSAADTGDLWFKTDSGNKAHYWDGDSWESLPTGREALSTDVIVSLDAAVKTYITEYAVNSSETVAPTTGWSTATPTRTPGTFIWFRTTITRNDNTTSTTSPALLTGNTGATGSQGIQGPSGANGQSLYTWIKYADTPTTGMSDLPTGKTYMGVAYNKTSSTESSTYGDYAWSLIQGPEGDQGIQGPAGADGQPTYTWIKYADSVAGAGLSDSPVGKTYLGIAYNKTTATESSTPGDYAWSLIQGPQGSQGIQGPAGTNGQTLYTWLKYADTPTTGMSDLPAGKTYIGLAYNKTSATESSVYSDYAWSLIQGPQGDQGVQGPTGANGQPTYTWIKYGDSAAGAGLSDSPVGKTYIGIAYNKLTQTESATPTDYEWSLIQGPQGPAGANAPAVSLTATAQVLTAPSGGGATNPTTSTVTGATVNTTITAWTYSVDGAAFSATVPAGVSRTGNVVTITGATMTARTIAVRMADANGVADTLTVARVFDGATGSTGGTGSTGPAGADAYTVLLTNEANVFPGSTTAALAGSTTSQILAFKGTSQVAATIGTITGQVTGLTTSIQNNGTTTAGFTVTVTTSLTATSGELTVPVTVDGTAFTKKFSWSVSRTGATGNTGATGVSVTSITPYYAQVATGAAAPAKPGAVATPPAPWVATEPAYAVNTELYRTERIAFSNSTYAYTDVFKSSAYAAAAAALAAAVDAQATADGKTRSYFQNEPPTGLVAGDVGDMWFDLNDGNKLYRWSGTAWVVAQDQSLVASVEAYIHSRGTDLVTNGTGLLGNNTNFTWSTFDPTDSPSGITGSFTTASNGTRFTDEFIPVDPGKKYIQSVWVRQQIPGVVSRAFVGLAPFDGQQNTILPHMYVYQARTMTTLAQPLNVGQTTLTLTSVPGGDEWTRVPAYKYVGLWNWTDPNGKIWPAATYTRNTPEFTSISGNVVTLSAPYAGPALPAGTPVSRNYPGNNYMYTTMSNDLVPEVWTQFKSSIITGVFNGASETTNGANVAFPPGTSSVKLLFLDNYGGAAGGRQAFAGLSFSDASAAQNTADSKITTFYQTSPPVSLAVGDLWVDTNDGNKLYRANAIGVSGIVTTGSGWYALPVGLGALDSTVTARALGSIATYSGASDPALQAIAGDLWLKPETANGASVNVLYRRNDTDTGWVRVDDPAAQQAIADAAAAADLADAKMQIFPQDSAPTGLTATDNGDLWIDTNDGNKTYRYLHGSTAGTNGSGGAGPWISILDASVASIQYVNQQVTLSASGKNKSTYSTGVPGTTANIAGDIWFQYNGSNQIIGQWRGAGGTSWTPVTLENSVIASIDAGKINTGFLDVANRIQAGSLAIGQVGQLQATLDSNLLAISKVSNPSQTGVVTPWTSTAGSTLTVEDVTFQGQTMKAMKFAATGTNTASSGYFSVDTTKTYEIRFRVKDPTLVTGTQFYFGLNVLNNAGVATGIETVPVATGVPGAVSGNFYHFFSSGVHADFTEYVAYIFPVGATAAQMAGLGNVTTNARFLPGTNRVQVRFLNWSNTGPVRNLWLSDITVTETNAIITANADATTKAATARTGAVDDLKTLWGHPSNSTLIDGGDLYTNSVRAQSLLLTDINNYLSDPGMLDPTSGSWALASGSSIVVSSGTTPGYMILNASTANTNAHNGDAAVWATEAGSEYNITFEYSTVASNTGNITFTPSIYVTNSSNAAVAFLNGDGVVLAPGATNWTSGSYSLVMPANSAKFRWFPFVNSATVGNKVWVRNIKVRRKNGGSLIVDGAIKTEHIETDAIKATHIDTGAIEAGHIDVEYLRSGFTLSGRVQVGESYWTPREGLVIPQPNGGRIQLPADGVTPARFDGQANLDATTIRGNMNIMGATNKISGQLGLAAGITEPTVAPSLYQSWPTVPNTHVNGADAGWRVYNGMTTHHSDSTLAVSAVCFGSGGLAFWNKTTGAWAGNMPDQTYMSNYMPWGGVAFQNSHYFTYGYDSTRHNWFVYKINPTTWAKVGEIQVTTDSFYHQNATPAITASAGMVQIASFVKGTAGQMRLQRWYADTLAFWNYNDFAVYGTNRNIAAATIHAADNGVDTLWIGVEGEGRFRAYPMNTLTETTNLSFGFASGANVHGLMWDTALSRFRSYDKSGNLHTYSSWKTDQLVTASNTWYDGTGTVRETREGPAASYTLPARSHLTVETPVPPDSGNTDAAQVDKANRVKIYVATGANARRLQSTLGVDANGVSLRTATYDTISTGTALAPASNTFIGGLTSPGKIVSAATDANGPLTSLDGSGAARIAGATMGDTGWVSMTYANGWITASGAYGGLAYRVINGVCHLRGRVQQNSSGASAWTVAVLPAAARPVLPTSFPQWSGAGPVLMTIADTGHIDFPGNSYWGTWLSVACSYPVV